MLCQMTWELYFDEIFGSDNYYYDYLLNTTKSKFWKELAVKKQHSLNRDDFTRFPFYMTEIIYKLCGSTQMQEVNQEVAFYQENGKTGTA